MLVSILAIVGGISLMVWSGERLVTGAAALARNFGVPPMVIGLTVIGVGTSAPEILVASTAAWRGSLGMAVGNAIGSNIANVGLVLGVGALVVPIAVRSRTLSREFPYLFLVIGLAWLVLRDGQLSRIDGVALGTGFVLLLLVMVRIALIARHGDPMRDEFAQAIPSQMHTKVALAWSALGLLVLLLSARLIVWGAVNVALALGVSELVVGLSIVAVGTSLPELTACITSILKDEHDIAIGNVIGSNMFNLLPVLGVPALIAPGYLPGEVMQRDFPVMLGLSVLLFMVAFAWRGAGRIHRWEGGVLLLAFCGYQALLYARAVSSPG